MSLLVLLFVASGAAVLIYHGDGFVASEGTVDRLKKAMEGVRE